MTQVMRRTWEDFQRAGFYTHLSFHPDGFRDPAMRPAYRATIIHASGQNVSVTDNTSEANVKDACVQLANQNWPCDGSPQPNVDVALARANQA